MVKSLEEDLQKEVVELNKEIETITKQKEKDIMTI